jgi:hypothetical protein
MEAVFRPKIIRLFQVDSCQLPVLSGRSRPEIIGKNPENHWNTRKRLFPDRTVRPRNRMMKTTFPVHPYIYEFIRLLKEEHVVQQYQAEES